MTPSPTSPTGGGAPKKRKRHTPSPTNASQSAETHQSTSDKEAQRQRKRLKRLQKAGNAGAAADGGGQGSDPSTEKGTDEMRAGKTKDKPDEGKKKRRKKVKRPEDNDARNAGDHTALDQEISKTTSDGRSRPDRLTDQASDREPQASTSSTTRRREQMEIDSVSTINDKTSKSSTGGVNAQDSYGPGVPVTSRTEKLFATTYYPRRTEPLKVPCGKILQHARAARYEGMSTQEVATRVAEHDRAYKNCPLVFQEAFKGTARGLFDSEVHRWLVPILWNYHNRTQRGDRIQYLQSTIRDLFKVFRDLHPDFLKLKDVEMELDYHSRIRNRISTAYYQIARTLKIPGKLEFIDKEVVKYLVEGGTRQRPHDLWARAEIAKGGDESEDSGAEADKGSDAGVDEEASASTYVKDWQAEMERQKKTMSKKKWLDNRLQLEQEFRKREFAKLGETAKAFWNAQANADEKPVDEMAGLARGLPFVNLVLSRFSKLTGTPVLILVGAPDYNEPTKLVVYHNLCNEGAPADIQDFWNGSDQFGDLTVLPRWRGYTEDYYGRRRGEGSIQTLSMPTFVEAEAQEVGAPAPEVPPATVIEIPWTREPENWAIDSKEKSAFKTNLQRGLTDAYKRTFSKTKVDFNSLAQRPLDFVERKRIPVCTMFCSFSDNGTMALKEIPEGHHADLAWPANPSQMAPHHLHAYYHNIFDSGVPESKRFRWKPSLAAGGYIPSTILVGASQGTSAVPEKTAKTQATTKSTQPVMRPSLSKKSQRRPSAATSDDESESIQRAKRPSASRKSKKRPLAATSDDESETTQRAKRLSSSKRSKERPSAATSDEESEMSTESDTSSSGETPNISDDEETESDSDSGSPTGPDPVSRQRIPVQLRTGRVSKPMDAQSPFDSTHRHSPKRKDKGKAVDPAERPFGSNNRLLNNPAHPPRVEGPVGLPQKSSTGRPTAASESPRSLYRLRPSNAKLGKLIPLTHSRHVAGLSLQEDSQNIAGLSKLPKLHELIQCSAELDCVFPPPHTSPLLPWCTDNLPLKIRTFCQDLISPTCSIPTFLQFTNACSTDGQRAKDVLESAMKHVEDSIDYLEGLNMTEPGPKMIPAFSSWTPVFLACARLLAFLGRVPPDDYADITERFKLSHRRTVELIVMSLVIRYCGSTISGIVSALPAPTPLSTIANAFAVIGSAWLRYLASMSSPINKLDLRQVLGSNWAAQVNPSGSQDENFPFFNLDSASLRWLSFTRTSKLEAEIMSCHKSLQQGGEVFRDRSVFEQFTIIGSINAIHTGATRKTSDEHWIQAIDRLRSQIDELARTSDYETVHLNPPPPPTLIGATPQVPSVHSSTNAPAPLPRSSEAASACPQTPAPPSTMPPTSAEQHPKSTERSTPPPATVESPARGAAVSPVGDPEKESETRRPRWAKPVTPAGPSTGQIGASESDQTLPEASEQRNSYKRPRKKKERSSWIAGDILRVHHEGEMRQAMVRQKGPVRSNLVLTSPESRTILLGSDGSDSPLPPFDPDILLERGPSDPRMHPNCFVREQSLPPLIPLEEIATGRYKEHFRRLWEKYPDEPAPPEFDEDFIDSYEEYETPQRLKNLLLDRSRRELFRQQCNVPLSDYDTRLAELIEEVTALAALEREPATSPPRPRSPATSSSTSSHSSTESSIKSNGNFDPGEKSNQPRRSSEDLAEEAAALAALEREPATSPVRPGASSTSPSTSRKSSNESFSSFDEDSDPGEKSNKPSRSAAGEPSATPLHHAAPTPSRAPYPSPRSSTSSSASSKSSRPSPDSSRLTNKPGQPASEQRKSVIDHSGSPDRPGDDGGVQTSCIPPSRISPGPDVQASDLPKRSGNSGIEATSSHGDTPSKGSECNSQAEGCAESVHPNDISKPVTTARNDSPNAETGSSSLVPAQSQPARVEGVHLGDAHQERPGPSTTDLDDTDGEPITGLENQVNVPHQSPKAAMQGFENVPLSPSTNATVAQASVSADIQTSEQDQELDKPVSKPRGPPRGPRPPAGPPTRSSPRILASATSGNLPVPTPINPAAEAAVEHAEGVSRNTRSRSKSTSGNTPGTPRAARAAKKPTPQATTSAIGKKTRQASGKP